MENIKGYEKLKIYERSYKATIAIYKITEEFPFREMYGLIDQMRRASTSIPLNIAEGYAKKESQREFKRFLMMAMESSNEMSVLINLARGLGYMEEEKRYIKAKEEYEDIGKMLNVFIQKVNKNI